ncbi:NACHT, LRR and PYD domains-containing protein 12-like isoform X4 [Astyanax mexicanus]|uniref:NACHT, LRR and PYD domains-containing protein 12-like isoform X4 n=1 Tax=Astyanax mexicanus TaxID=7994 RepID=UPI0020CB37EF|nr:NACHT, LRR and PYD domains-containing protein 12-like isoform X4 [Astyanax mexicanus]
MKSDRSKGESPNFSSEAVTSDPKLDQDKRSDSPEPSCVSMKSDQSMDYPINFREDNRSADLRLDQDKRSDSPEPSCVSMKSDWSMDHPIGFRKDNSSADLRLDQDKRSDSPEPSCVSMKSDQSMGRPIDFREDNSSADLRLDQDKRSDSPEPSCVSMKSDQSMGKPLDFREDNRSTDLSEIPRERTDPPEPSCVSMKSDQSMGKLIEFREDNSSADLRVQKETPEISRRNMDFILKELEHKVISLVKNQLKRFVKILKNLDYPACSGREEEDEEDQSGVREGALKITLHVLRNMNQTDLANKLQTKLAPSCHRKLKSTLKEKFQKINEGISNAGTSTLLNEIYTDLYITEGGSGEVNNEHEVRQIEAASRRPATQETPIKCNDLFKDQSIRTVLTKGVAGIGKTVSVQKFILDWTEGKANQDVPFIFPLPFRELNLMKTEKISLEDLLHQFFKDTKDLKRGDYHRYKVMFIFDGLDECRLPLDFQNNKRVSDVTQSASVDVLLTNLIQGNLLPCALLWITTRPAAANQIPPDCIDQVTEVRGFSDHQKEEYFRKRIRDQSLAERIITHMKSSRSLYIMCHIPVFCWISATVLERMLGEAEGGEIPKTLTQMFTHFLIFQIKHRSQKYQRKSDVDLDQTREIILALGKLAFQQLEKGNLIFYEEDLRECSIDVREVSVYLGVCTQIFRQESELHLGKVFSFVHLSVQEFLAALYEFLSFISNNRNVLQQQHSGFGFSKKGTMSDFLKRAVDKALQSENGHLDLFLRFLLGLSLESNQTLLRGLLIQTENISHSKEKVVEYIKQKIRKNPSPEKTISLFHCLNELNDHSLVQEVQKYLNRGGSSDLSGAKLSPDQWSAVAFVMVNSEEELDEFELKKFDKSEECLLRMLPVVKVSRKVVLCDCSITEKGCAALFSALKSNPSHMKELNLNYSKPGDSGVKLLSEILMNPLCKLNKLQLEVCSITEKHCADLVSALKLNPSELRELNLSYNKPGVKFISGLLEDPRCKLEKLQLEFCSITGEDCAALVSALKSNPSHLRELNLNYNKPGESGVKLLTDLLKDSHFKLEKLQLEFCSITVEDCAALVSALKSNLSHLRELNLNYNKPGESGVKLLTDLLKDPHYKLEKLQICESSQLHELNLSKKRIGDSGVKLLSGLLEDPHCNLEKLHLAGCNLSDKSCADLASGLSSNSSTLRELNLSGNKLQDSGVKLLSAGLKNPHCKLETLWLWGCNLSDKSCADLASALSSNSSTLRDLNLGNNKLQDSGVKLLSAGLKKPHCKLEKLGLWGCNLSEKSCADLASALSSNSSTLRELNLNNNKLQDSGVKLLSAGLKSSHCKLEKLKLRKCNLSEKSCADLASALNSISSTLRELDLGNNKLQDSGVKLLSAGLKNSHCKLEKLELYECSITGEGCAALASALKSNPSHLRELDLRLNNPGESGKKLLSDLQKDLHFKLETLYI